MLRMFCEYCGAPLIEMCECELEAQEEQENLIEEIEERQHNSGFYSFQDLLCNLRREK